MKKLLLIAALLSLSACHRRITGPVGPKGADGQDGAPGSSCSVQQMSNGAIITCQDGTSAVILNGADGSDAPPTAYSVVELINPCGDAPGYDEILLRLHNGQLIAHFSHGNKQFLTLLTPGTYQTTDGTNCLFSVDSNLNVTW